MHCYFTLYFQFWLRLSLAVLASWLADPDFILPRRSFSFWIYFIFFWLFLFFFFFSFFFFFFPFFIFPLKKSLMRFPIGQIWSDPRSLIFHFLFISAQKQHGDISFSTRHTHKHILRAHTDRRDEDWHFSWSRPFNSNRTTLTQSYRKKWLSNQMASSTDLTRQHRR